MRVLIYGQDNPWALGRLCAHGLEAAGHDVTYVDSSGKWHDRVPVVGPGKRRLERLVETASRADPDAVLVVRGYDLNPETVEELWAAADAPVTNWNPDNPFMARYRREERKARTYVDALPAYDIVFTWGEFLINRLYEKGANDARYLPFAHDPRLHRPADPKLEFECDVIFLGHYSKKRHRILSSLTDFDLKIYGDKWGRKSLLDRDLRECVEGGPVTGPDYSRAMCSAKMVVNVTADHAGSGANMRTFEIPATGRLMVTNRTSGQRRFFEDGEAAAMYEGADDIPVTVARYLENDVERERIATNGRDIAGDHTYAARMETFVETIRGLD